MVKAVVQAPVSEVTGYGKDGIGIVRALQRCGVEVYLFPTEVITPLPKDIAGLLLRPPNPPYDILIQHVEPKQLSIDPDLRRQTNIAIAWSMWEWNSFERLENKDTLTDRLKEFDLVLGYSHNTVEAFNKTCGDALRNDPQLLQGGYDSQKWSYQARNWTGVPFTYFMLGKLGSRKNSELAIQAFTELKEEHNDFHARLNLKTYASELDHLENYHPDINIYTGTFSHEGMKKFYSDQHVLLAPSHGEGKNLPALEFMTTGGVVIGASWAGHRGWMSPEYSYPVRYELIPYEDDENTAWAQPDKEHFKEQMLHVYNNRGEARQKGLIASSVIPQMLDWDSVIDKLFMRIKRLQNGAAVINDIEFSRAQEANSRDQGRD
jgi:glycosyltransferase involved in cell wall biosynthesis